MSRYIRREKDNFRLTSVSPHVRKFKTRFWTPSHGFRILGTGFWIPCHWNLDSGFQWFAEFRVSWAEFRSLTHKISVPQAQIFLIWVSKSKNFSDPGIRIPLHGAICRLHGAICRLHGAICRSKRLCISSLLDSFLLPLGKLPNPPKHSAKYWAKCQLWGKLPPNLFSCKNVLTR